MLRIYIIVLTNYKVYYPQGKHILITKICFYHFMLHTFVHPTHKHTHIHEMMAHKSSVLRALPTNTWDLKMSDGNEQHKIARIIKGKNHSKLRWNCVYEGRVTSTTEPQHLVHIRKPCNIHISYIRIYSSSHTTKKIFI